MSMYFSYDVIVVGAGHAGCEAASAAARMGAKTCLITMDMNKIAQMSCNPAVGGIAKGQIVREVDALGGQMGLVTDATAIQFKMLNRSKGPAMWSPRAQCDRAKFITTWRKTLENTENLHIWQDQVCEITVKNGEVTGVTTIWGATFTAHSVIITAGTFLNGLMHIGRRMVEGGRCAEPAAKGLTESITAHGIRTMRMKTGTPVRIDKRSVHFDLMETDYGEDTTQRFSFVSSERPLPQLPCWTTNTNAEVHEVLRSGLKDSPLYNGQIQSIGPRYCPSIETKLVTFAERDQHPLFLEPEGVDTNELYLNGFSSSLPMDIQIAALKKIPCFKDIVIYRPGYAIEYDFFDPTQLSHTLESKIVKNLYFAGQVNGTTGYEEAAGQGLVAGINAALSCNGKETFTLRRDEAYIGVLIDDLVTKGVDEPYRMFTSRAEYRILLRQDNADSRLTPYAEKYGLATAERIHRKNFKEGKVNDLIELCKNISAKPNEINAFLTEKGTSELKGSSKVYELLTRPQITLEELYDNVPFLKTKCDEIIKNDKEIMDCAEIEIKYSGYIHREKEMAEKMQRLENIIIKNRFNYQDLKEISTEGRQKLSAINPETLGQASRIPGVSPSDISVLLILLGR